MGKILTKILSIQKDGRFSFHQIYKLRKTFNNEYKILAQYTTESNYTLPLKTVIHDTFNTHLTISKYLATTNITNERQISEI